jgi:hypothetical protein
LAVTLGHIAPPLITIVATKLSVTAPTLISLWIAALLVFPRNRAHDS